MTVDYPQFQAEKKLDFFIYLGNKKIPTSYQSLDIFSSTFTSDELYQLLHKRDILSETSPTLLPSFPPTPMTPPISPSPAEPTTKIRVIDLITIIGSIIIPLIAIAITIFIHFDNKIDNGFQEMRDQAREDRKLIISAIRDFNNRIDATDQRVDNANQRIDQVYQAPSIKSS